MFVKIMSFINLINIFFQKLKFPQDYYLELYNLVKNLSKLILSKHSLSVSTWPLKIIFVKFCVLFYVHKKMIY